MIEQQNPFGLSTITPYLTVTHVERLIQFLQDVFDGKLRGDIKYRNNKTVQHAEIKIGDSIIMLAEPTPEYPEIKPTTCGMYVYVNDCEKVYEKALKKGGISISEPADYPHGDRYGGVKDFAGNIWWIVTHKMKYKAVIFDLDGTLVDSLHDIADSMNIVLQSYNFPTHSYEKHQSFIGSGIRSLVIKSLPLTHRDEEQIDRCFNSMIEVYRDNCTHKTKPYDGIIELLDNLISRDIKISVLSNKADEFTKKITHTLFPNYFDPVLGLTIEAHKKPNPFGAVDISKNLGIKAEEIIYVGDTGIDMQTANNANMFAVGVLWGFRPKEELISNGAKYILSNPLDLMQMI